MERITEKKVIIHVYEDPQECPEAFEWVELQKGPHGVLPVHVRDIPARLRHLLTLGAGYSQDTVHMATVSDDVIAAIGWMVRRKELQPQVHIYYHSRMGRETREQHPEGELIQPDRFNWEVRNDRCLRFDIVGDLIDPWPEVPTNASIQDAGFFFRYDRPKEDTTE